VKFHLVLGVGKSFVASNAREFCFSSSKKQKLPDKNESLNLNSIGTKIIVVFAAVLLMASNIGRVTYHHSIPHGNQSISIQNFHASIREKNV